MLTLMEITTAKQLERRLTIAGLITNVLAGSFIALFAIIAFGIQRIHFTTLIPPVSGIFLLDYPRLSVINSCELAMRIL